MNTTSTRRPALTATMTADAGIVTVTITDQTGNVIDTATTKETGKFLTRLDKTLTGKGFARTGYTATNGALVATVTDYRPF
jgi:hypothetical protein